MYIFCTKITRDGVTYYARDYGKRAFRIYIDEADQKRTVKR